MAIVFFLLLVPISFPRIHGRLLIFSSLSLSHSWAKIPNVDRLQDTILVTDLWGQKPLPLVTPWQSYLKSAEMATRPWFCDVTGAGLGKRLNLEFQRDLGCPSQETFPCQWTWPSMCPFGVCLSIPLLVLCPWLSQREGGLYCSSTNKLGVCLQKISNEFLIFLINLVVIISNFI